VTIFDFISSALFTKKKTCLTSVDEESDFSPYMLNRWCSMYSPAVALYCNALNKYLSIFEGKKDLYNLFVAVLPSVPSKRIAYIKKVKEEKTEIDENIPLIAENAELSQREIKQYIALQESLYN
jgi:hypothetical protein